MDRKDVYNVEDKDIIMCIYLNVIFCMKVVSEEQIYMADMFFEGIKGRKDIRMADISRWCTGHGIPFVTCFTYRKDLPVTANIWNYITYLRFLLDERSIL